MRCLTLALVVLLAITVAAQTTPINVNQTLSNQIVVPCTVAQFSVAVTDTTNTYLSVSVTSNSTETYLEVSNSPDYFLGVATIYETTGPLLNPSIALVCNFTAGTWYISVTVEEAPANFSLTVTQYPITYTPVTIGVPVYNTPKTYNNTAFTNQYDFYQFQITQTSPSQGQTLVISITENSGQISAMYLNKGLAPAPGCSLSNSGATWTVDYCTLTWLLPQAGQDYYLSVLPTGTAAITYTLTITLPYPTIQALTLGQLSPVTSLTQVGQIQYYSLSIANNTSDAQVLNISVSNVQNGEVTMQYSFGNLPFVSCLGASCPSGNSYDCCQDVDTACQLVVQACNIQTGTYYIGVQQTNFAYYAVYPIYYQIQATLTELGEATDLFAEEYYTGSVSQAQYNHFLLDATDVDVGDQTLVNFHLYVDSGSQTDTGVQTFLFVNYNNFAGSGSNTSCWENIASCSVNANGACTVQISSCQFNLYPDWYTSVFVSDQGTFYGGSVSYTIAAEVVDPVSLDTPFLVLQSSLAPAQYDHYTLDGSLLNVGERVALYVFDVAGGPLTLYKNNGNLAGDDSGACPRCYNYTETRSVTGTSYAWVLANCDQKANLDFTDLYFSILNTGSQQTSYSLTLITDDGDDEDQVSQDLEQNEVLVDSIAPVTSLAYSVRSDPGEESYLRMTLNVVDYAISNLPALKLTLSNTTYYNCVPSDSNQEAYFEVRTLECTVDSNGYCSIVIQNCIYNVSDGWIAQVYNPSTTTTVYFNLWYDIYQATPTPLANLQILAGAVQQNVYNQYQYETKGADTFIIEVFFDTCIDQNGDACAGTLYVSEYGPTGPYDPLTTCVPAFFNGTDTSRVVYVASSCTLDAQLFYFAVGTTSPLDPSYPLRYTITVTEESYAVPTALNTPKAMQIYAGQKIYHTFNVSLTAAQGSLVYVVLNNVQGGNVYSVLAEAGAPGNNTCCYEYSSATTVEYCQATVLSGTWSVLVQADSDTPFQPLGYTIYIGTEQATPSTLNLNTAYTASVPNGLYDYYSIDSTIPSTSQLIMTLTNYNDGTLVPYYSSSNPATANCADGSLPACQPGTTCSYQIQSCIGSPNYISIQGVNGVSFSEISYQLSLSEVQLQNLTAVATPSSLLGGFSQVFGFNANLTNFLSPQITVSVAGATATGGSLGYRIRVSTDLCDDTSDLASTNCNSAACTLRLSPCDLISGFYYVIVQYTGSASNGASLAFNISASAVDLTAGAASIAPNSGGQTIVGVAGQLVAFYTTVPGGSNDYRSLTYQVSGLTGTANLIYFNYETATPGCSLVTNSATTYTVSSCCTQTGNYYLLVQPVNNGNFTVTFTLNSVATFVTGATDTAVISPNVYYNFDLPAINTTNYVSFYYNYYSNSTLFSTAYWQRVTAAGAGTANQYCLTNAYTCAGFPDCGGVALQCDNFNSDTISQSYLVGSVYGSAIATFDPLTDVTVSAGVLTETVLNNGQAYNGVSDFILPSYFSFSVPAGNLDASNELNVAVTSNSTGAVLITQLYRTDRCTTNIGSCSGNCSVTESTCTNIVDYFITLSVNPAFGPVSPISYSVTATIQPAWSTTTALVPGTPSATATGLTYYSVNVTGTSTSVTNYFEFYVLGFDSDETASVQWAISGAPICLQDAPLSCYPSSSGAGLTDCLVYVADCQLTDGVYYFSASVTGGANYTVSWTGLQSKAVVELAFGVPAVGTLQEYEQTVYRVGVNTTTVKLGQEVVFTTTARCGSVSTYLNLDAFASPVCGTDIGSSFVLPACFANLISEVNVEFYIAVVGGATDYPEYGVPSEYSISAEVTGDAATIVPLGMNQVTTFQNNNTIFALPIAGISDFSGQLEVVYSWETYGGNYSTTPTDAVLAIYFDENPFCGLSVATLQLSATVPTQSVIFDACELATVRTIYFYSGSAVPGSNVQVINSANFIRNLDTYPENPQSGSVVSPSVGNFVDEEHYSITFNETGWNFQFTAWFEGDNIYPGLTLAASQEVVPSFCFPAGSNGTTKVTGSEVLTLDWCQVDPDYPVYMTVNLPSGSPYQNSAYEYELGWSLYRTKNPIVLSSGEAKCETVEADDPLFFNFAVPDVAGTYWELEIYAIDGNGTSSCDLDVYVSYGSGLATQNCFTETLTCNGACDGGSENNCVFENFCYSAGNVSVGVYNNNNGGAPITFFIQYTSIIMYTEALPATPLVGGNALSSASVTLYYTVTVPVLGPNQLFSLFVDSQQGNNVEVYYLPGQLPSAACGVDGNCNGPTCVVDLSPCTTLTTSTKFYVSVTAVGSYTIYANTVTVDVFSLNFNTFYEDALTEGSLVTFSLTIDSTILTGAQSDITVSVYGVHTGTITAWIAKGFIGGVDCALAIDSVGLTSSSAVNLVIPACDLVAGTYYITLQAASTSTCAADVPFGVAAFFGTTKPATSLTIGTPLVVSVPWASPSAPSKEYYSAKVTSPGIIVTVLPPVPGVGTTVDVTATAYWSGNCGSEVTVPYQYFWWCAGAVPSSILYEVSASAPNDGTTLPGQTYSIVASNLVFTNLATVNATSQTFASDLYNSVNFYQFTFSSDESLEIVLTLNQGPMVTLDVLADCETTLTSLDCYSGECTIPLTYTTGDLLNGTVYYITVTGAKPSNYDLMVLNGQDQTCEEPTNTTLCSVDWTVWNYGTGETGYMGQDEASLRLYYQLVAAFVPSCEELSSDCNDSLIEYACTQSYRACDGSGFSSSICEDSCNDVEANCGYTFTEVGLPWLSCSHNYYYTTGDQICEDIYDVETGGGNKLLWLIVLIVVFLVLIIFIGIGVFIAYKKIKASKLAVGSYEAIDDNEAYEEPHSDSD